MACQSRTRRLKTAAVPAAVLLGSLLSLLQTHVGDAAAGGVLSAELLEQAAAARPTMPRLRGGELGAGTKVRSPLISPQPSSARRSPMYSSELRPRQSTVHFESSQTKDQTQSQASPMLDHISALKLEQRKLKQDYASPTALRTSDGEAHGLDLSSPLAGGTAAINRAFASLANAAGTPNKHTPARGWPARFRHELELLKTAMETYSASHQEAMQALTKEREKTASLAEQKALLEKSMHEKLTEMDRVKSTMEMRAAETEERLQALRHQIVSQEVHDSEVSAQLAKLEEAKGALQARAARASEEADALRQQLSSARSECSTLQEARQHLELRVQEIGPLQERLQLVAAAKEESERQLGHLGTQLRRVQSEAQTAGTQVSKLKMLLQDNDSKQEKLEKEIKVLNKEKSAVIEQLRAADRSGREAREEGQQLVREWQQRHAELEASLQSKSSQAVSVERTCKALRRDLAAAQAREKEEARKLAQMTEMKASLETQVAHLTAVDSRRQQETQEMHQAVRSLEARLRQSETEMAELRQELSRAEEDKDEIEGLLEARSTELADSALRQQEALESLEGKDAQLEALQARLEQATAASQGVQMKLEALEADYSAAASLLNKAQASIVEHQKEQLVLETKVGELEKANVALRCEGDATQKAVSELQVRLKKAQQDARDKSQLVESGMERAESLQKEISRLNRHVKSVEQVKKVLKKEAETTHGEISQLQAELDRRQQQLEEGTAREEGAQEQLQALQEVSRTLEKKLQLTQTQAETLRNQISTSEQEVAQLKKSLAAECASKEDLASELERLKVSISSQVQASQDTSGEWEQRYAALENDMQQAQAQLGAARTVLVERDHLRTQVAGFKEEMSVLQQQIAEEQEREALWHEQLRQVETLAQDLQQKECAAEQRAVDLENANSALRTQLQESEARSKKQQGELEAAVHKLDALTTVRDALEKQTQVMSYEAMQIQEQLRLGVSDSEKNELRQQLQVLEGVRETLSGRLTAADEEVEKLEVLLQQERAEHAETRRELDAERQNLLHTRLDLVATQEKFQGEMKRQQADIDALARRNTELVGVRASLARRLNAAEQSLAEARAQNDALMQSMQDERALRLQAQNDVEQSQRQATSHQQQIAMMHKEIEKANNVTWQQWNLLDAARAHLSEVCAAKATLEAERARYEHMLPYAVPRPRRTLSLDGFVSHLNQVCQTPRSSHGHKTQFTPALDAPAVGALRQVTQDEEQVQLTQEDEHVLQQLQQRAGQDAHQDLEIQMRELMEEKYRLEEVAEQQKNDLLRLRSVLLQAPPTLSPLADALATA